MQFKSHHIGEESSNSFAVKIETLVREIIIQNEIPYYRIESGVEHLTSMGAEEKLPVIRIITYFEDTVNKISHILHDEFNVDIELSTDKKKIRIETFAYKNINYTAQLTTARQIQTEYKRSGNKKFEIQICSMLQDAWTGIEKELGYDSNFVPDEAKRDFYRVGALLEMADIEFLKIRTELSQKLNKNTQPAVTPVATEQLRRDDSQDKAEDTVPMAMQAEEESVEEENVDNNANTFLEHLQAVAREVQKEAASAPVQASATPQEPQQTFNVIPEEEFSYILPQRSEPEVIAEPEPQPVMQQPVYTPPPVVQQPVYTPPPVVQQPVYTPPPPVQQPVFTAPPPAPAHAPVTNMSAAQSIVPKRVATPQPIGVAPKPISLPRPEPIQSRLVSDIDVNNLKELANSINHIENKPAPKQEPVAPKEPSVIIPPPAMPVIPELPKQAPQVIAPVVEKIVPPAPQPPVIPFAEGIGAINVNSNGIIQKVTELPKDTNIDKTVPLYNDQPKPKAIQFDENAHMTDITLREFVMNSKLVKEVDQKIAERAGAKINSDIDIEGDVERLRFLKVFTLKQLQDRITDNKEDIVAFAEKWIGKDNGGSFDSGICLFYLEYLLVGKRNDPAFAVEYVVKFISDNDYSARYIIPTYNSIHNTEAPNFSHLTLRA